ncbi:LytTR family DNA-binding domain-containing protein [Alishewanella sp. d11]|uniref:LytTR family DNA-binding domain-containing protein n=1 Tax=Alishewanella sp. d11 TaxID=3414030 RepID=UPI003BF91385
MQKQTFDFGDISPLRYFFTIALVLALLFALIDNNQNLPFWLQLPLWLYQSVVPMALMLLSHKGLAHLAPFNALNAWLKLLLSGLLGALSFVPFALAIDVFLGLEPTPNSLINWLFALWQETLGVLPPVVLCWLAINAPWVLGFKMVNPNAPAAATQSAVPSSSAQSPAVEDVLPSTTPDALQALLPKSKQGELLYLKSELHYLLVVTEAGQTLILANLKDAITLCANIAGIQPHRSYWVSKKAIKALRKTGREGSLILHNGQEIPVSRNKLNHVKTFLL